MFHPQYGTGSIIDILHMNDKTLIEVVFQTGERRKYNQQAASKLQIEKDSEIVVGSRVEIYAQEAVVAQIHAQKGFWISFADKSHHDRWITHALMNQHHLLPGFDWGTAGFVANMQVKHDRNGRGIISSIKDDKLYVDNGSNIRVEYQPSQLDELLTLGPADTLYTVVVETGANVDPKTLQPVIISHSRKSARCEIKSRGAEQNLHKVCFQLR